LQLFVQELSKQNVQITVFTLHYPYRNQEYFWNGITVVPLNGENKFLRRKFMFPKLKASFAEKEQLLKFDVIHAFWLNEATSFAIKLGKQLNIPVIATAMGQDVLKQNDWLKKMDFSFLSEIIMLSKFHQNEAKKSSIENSRVIHFGIEGFIESVPNKIYDFITIGNLIPLKQFDYFIDVLAEVKKQAPGFRAIVIGDGIERKALTDRIQKNGLEENIELCGLLSYADTMEMLISSKVLIHPSKYESFGMIFIEALNLQTHVLASPVGIAMEDDLIHKLQFDVKKDAELALRLLEQPKPKQKVYEIKETVKAYLEIYNRF
jgi:glycosyltransferase involved in cell wall biosynthesis